MTRSCAHPYPSLQSKHFLWLPQAQTLASGWQLGQAPPSKLFSSESLPERLFLAFVTVIDCWWKSIKAAAGPQGLPDSSGRILPWTVAQHPHHLPSNLIPDTRALTAGPHPSAPSFLGVSCRLSLLIQHPSYHQTPSATGKREQLPSGLGKNKKRLCLPSRAVLSLGLAQPRHGLETGGTVNGSDSSCRELYIIKGFYMRCHYMCFSQHPCEAGIYNPVL